ncbi:MAG: hypothetical protein GKS05_05620 [Nitrospirales bacterium]|nr:hypothetical protein [Nitrospirales bacterium]
MTRVRHRVGIVGDINNIYRSMHEPVGLCGWWATTTDGTPKVGQVLDLHFTDVVTLSFRIDALEENALVRLYCVSGPGLWHDCSLEFSFKQDANQVWVELVHESEASSKDDFLYFNTKWTCYLLSLRDLIENGKGCPYPNDVKIHFGD